AGQHAVGQKEAHRVVRVPRRVEHLDPEVSDHQQLAIVDAQVGEGRRRAPVHDDAGAELAGELAGGGGVNGVGVAVDDVADAETLLDGECDVAVDQVERRIDDHPGARLLAAGDVGETPTGAELLEEHGGRYRLTSARPARTARAAAEAGRARS